METTESEKISKTTPLGKIYTKILRLVNVFKNENKKVNFKVLFFLTLKTIYGLKDISFKICVTKWNKVKKKKYMILNYFEECWINLDYIISTHNGSICTHIFGLPKIRVKIKA